MSNRSLIIIVLALIGATAYLLLKGDGDIDMGGEKHGAEATHVEEAKKDAPAAAPAAPAAAPAADAKTYSLLLNINPRLAAVFLSQYFDKTSYTPEPMHSPTMHVSFCY